ncbi:MAG: D-arabinose dehydrogenase [Desulfobacteraceae bacterium 4484_190.1]|nr:MAG: D-arabinose dehydrogenase [Desulfobacteraceae bacterium 4484_190.1]
MKAALLYQFDETLNAPDWLSYEEVPDPVIEEPTDVIVRIGGAGVCGTDLKLIKGLWCDHMRIELPMILGHENAGWVEETGRAVESVQVGDPVILHPTGAGGLEASKAAGNHRSRKRGLFPGFNRNGGFAEYMLAEEGMLLKLPSHLSPMDTAPLADAGLTAYNAARRAAKHLTPGHYTLVIGAGGLGHLCIQILGALSSTEIIVVDKSKAALDLARSVGAHYTFIADEHYTEKILSLTGGKGVETVIDFVGTDTSVNKGLFVARRGGYYYLVGYGGRLTLSTLELVLSEKTIVGVLGGTFSDLKELLTMVDRGLVALTTREYSLSNANKALRDLKDGRNYGRTVLIP